MTEKLLIHEAHAYLINKRSLKNIGEFLCLIQLKKCINNFNWVVLSAYHHIYLPPL